jgi:hypothetical protein
MRSPYDCGQDNEAQHFPRAGVDRIYGHDRPERKVIDTNYNNVDNLIQFLYVIVLS